MIDLTNSVQDIDSVARTLVDLRATIQKARIQFGNRLDAIERGVDDKISSKIFEHWYEQLERLEDELDGDISEIAKEMPIVDRMISVKGVGRMLAVKVVALIDIRRADTISALWRYAGYGVTDGERDRLVKGQKAPYNKRLKTTCYLVGASFLKSNSPYRDIYDQAKDYYEANRPDWTKAHRHQAAMRKMIKIWLAHVWLVWRDLEGLPVSDPYIMAENGHHRYISPAEMGWQLAQAEEDAE